MTHARLTRAYRATSYQARGAVAQIGRRSPAIDALLEELGSPQGAFITGWNPHSRRHPDGRNQRWMRALQERLRRLPHALGQGGWRRWWEEHALVGADPRRCAVLAGVFRQSAMVVVRRRQPARLVIWARGP